MLNIPIAVQDALREGTMRKNYKMKVNDVDPDTGERTYSYTIENDELVSESVKIDERMVTGKNLKFGLCEGSVLEFQYFNHPNINGKDVQVYLSAEYVDTDDVVKWYDIPMGWYTVDQCPMQWDTGIYKVTAYNKLKSDYLDAKANQLIVDAYANINREYTPNPTIDDVLKFVLADFAIEESIPQSLTEGSDASSYRTNSGYRYSGIATITTAEKMPTYSIYQRNPASAFVYFYYVYGGVQIVVRGLNSLREYIRNHDCAIYDMFGASHFCISCKYGYDIFNYNYETYNYEISLDDNNDEIITPYFRDYYEYQGGASPDEKYKASFTIEIPMDSDISTSEGAIEVLDSLLQNVTYEFLYTEPSEIGSLEITNYNDWPDVTLRELQSAVYETACQYGKLDRETDLFTGVELNSGGLYPADTLYPDNALYPSGPSLHPFPSTYQKLWTDTVGEQSFRYLIITYKAIENGEEVEKTLQRTVNTYGTTNYNMSDNWLFRNLVWTAEDVGAYADAMVLKMKDVRWFPFELWCAGLPYIETGDAIEITDRQGNTHTSYVLTRTLDGIHNLQDTFINGELDIF